MQQLRAGLYLRQSVDEPEGIARQREKTRKQAELRGYEVSAVYEDNASSASKSRAGTRWAQMLDDASEVRSEDGRLLRGRKIDVVIAVDLDRLVRSVTDLGELIKRGVKVLTVDGEIDLTTADGEFRASMLAAIARFEVRRKSERQRRANETRATNGKRVGGRRPFGYEADGVTVRPLEAAAIQRGYHMLANEEMSLGDVARFWNSEGFTTGQNKRLTKEEKAEGQNPVPSSWTRSGVRQVMLNRRNIGQMVYLGQVQAAPAEWPALVDDDLFQTVHSRLTEVGRRAPGMIPIHLLTGIAVCAVCDGPIHAGGARRKGTTSERQGLDALQLKTFPSHRTYRCKNSAHVARAAQPIERFVEDVLARRFSRPSAINLLQPTSSADVNKLRAEERRVRERMDSLAAAFADEDDDPVLAASQLRIATRKLRDKIVEIQKELAERGRVDLLGPLVSLAEVPQAEREQYFRSGWLEMPMQKRRAVVRELLAISIRPPGRGVRTFRPETVTVEWLT